MLDFILMGFVSIRANAVTGAPLLSTPKKGKDDTSKPARKAAFARTSEAMTTPWPPLPWNLTSIKEVHRLFS
jgi:hypothetical protein